MFFTFDENTLNQKSFIDEVLEGKSLDYLFRKYKKYALEHSKDFIHTYYRIRKEMKD